LFGGSKKATVDSDNKIVQPETLYKVPEGRSIGRPHASGWLDLLEEDRVENADIYDSDNWREVNKSDV
jgi:hypothetical protein